MMRKLWTILVCLQLTAAGAWAQQESKQDSKAGKPRLGDNVVRHKSQKAKAGQPEEQIKLPSGPMRLEPFLVSEMRVRYLREKGKNAPESTLRLQATLTGERLPKIVGLGHMVVENLVDDTGAVLVSPADVQERDRKAITPIRMSKRILKAGVIHRVAEVKAPSRAARKITRATGWVHVVYADEREDILIDNPLQYMGGLIDNPRLRELGIKVRVIKPGKEVGKKAKGAGIALEFPDQSRRRIENIQFFDAWMKPLYPRPRSVTPPEGKTYYYYQMQVGKMDADTQMLLTVYPEVEEEDVRFEFKDIELP